MAIQYDGFGVRVEGRHFGGTKIPAPAPQPAPPSTATTDSPEVQEAAAKAAAIRKKQRGRGSTILAGESASPALSTSDTGRERLGD